MLMVPVCLVLWFAGLVLWFFGSEGILLIGWFIPSLRIKMFYKCVIAVQMEIYGSSFGFMVCFDSVFKYFASLSFVIYSDN
jgi:hypothetical protein